MEEFAKINELNLTVNQIKFTKTWSKIEGKNTVWPHGQNKHMGEHDYVRLCNQALV